MFNYTLEYVQYTAYACILQPNLQQDILKCTSSLIIKVYSIYSDITASVPFNYEIY